MSAGVSAWSSDQGMASTVTQLTSVAKLHDDLVRGVYLCILLPMARWLSGFLGKVPDHDGCPPPPPDWVLDNLMLIYGAITTNDVVARPYRGKRKDEVKSLNHIPLYRAILGVSLSTTDAVSIWGLIVRA